MTFLQHPNIAQGGRLWFRLVAGGLLTALVAACVVIPVGSSGQAPALNTVQSNFAIGVAVDAAGNVYVADTGNHRIRKITVSP